MITGHTFIGFAIVVLIANKFDVPQNRAIALGGIAAAFATLPDIDILFAGETTIRVLTGIHTENGFNGTLHRAVTHSLVIAPVATAVFGATFATVRKQRNLLLPAVGVATFLIGISGLRSGGIGAVTMGAFILSGVGLTVLTHRRTRIRTLEFTAVAFVGLASHPFGDVFTGEPPEMLYPLSATIVDARVLVAPDPTVNLLSIFLLEVFAGWAAIYAYATVTSRPILSQLRIKGLLGLVFGAIAFVIPPPTMETPYEFVYAVLAVSLFAIIERPHVKRPFTQIVWYNATITILTSMTLAILSYLITYLLVGGPL